VEIGTVCIVLLACSYGDYGAMPVNLSVPFKLYEQVTCA